MTTKNTQKSPELVLSSVVESLAKQIVELTYIDDDEDEDEDLDERVNSLIQLEMIGASKKIEGYNLESVETADEKALLFLKHRCRAHWQSTISFWIDDSRLIENWAVVFHGCYDRLYEQSLSETFSLKEIDVWNDEIPVLPINAFTFNPPGTSAAKESKALFTEISTQLGDYPSLYMGGDLYKDAIRSLNRHNTCVLVILEAQAMRPSLMHYINGAFVKHGSKINVVYNVPPTTTEAALSKMIGDYSRFVDGGLYSVFGEPEADS